MADDLSESVIIPLQKEDVEVTRKVERGDTIRVSTVTREHDVLVEQAVSKDRVEVIRVCVGREVLVAPEITQDGDLTIIPVIKEILVVQRKLILEEEVHIRRIRVEDQHHEIVTVREQEAIISRISNAGEISDISPEAQSHFTKGEKT